MRNIKLILAYDGSSYVGWQRQKNGLSIQEKMEEILKKILNENVRLISAGRTDAGVHAQAQVVNFKTSSSLPPLRIKLALNSLLPLDIRVRFAQEVDKKFHARYCAQSKIYRYYIYSGDVISPFKFKYVWHLPLVLNFQVMSEEIKFLQGRHNFSSFQAKGSSVCNPLRNVYRVDLRKKGLLYQFEIEANGFLYKMVRIIVGTLVEVGRGKFPSGRIQALLKGKNVKPGPAAPAQGLFLWKVIY